MSAPTGPYVGLGFRARATTRVTIYGLLCIRAIEKSSLLMVESVLAYALGFFRVSGVLFWHAFGLRLQPPAVEGGTSYRRQEPLNGPLTLS